MTAVVVGSETGRLVATFDTVEHADEWAATLNRRAVDFQPAESVYVTDLADLSDRAARQVWP